MKISEIIQPDPNSLPSEVLQAAEALYQKVAHNPMLCGDSRVVRAYWIETHTIGCRNAADDPEDEWWDRHRAIHDEYAADGISVVIGNPESGVFVTITPQKGLAESHMIETVDGDRLERSRQTIQALKTDPRFAPFRDRIRVFGSVIGGKTNPGDIDILVDLGGLNPVPKGTGTGMSALLELLKQYGRLDPFVYAYSRNFGKEVFWCAYGDYARPQWTIAKNARSILKAGREGQPLSEINI